jgi:hypothetical protein
MRREICIITDYKCLHKFCVKICKAINTYKEGAHTFNTLQTGDANLRFLSFCITFLKDG